MAEIGNVNEELVLNCSGSLKIRRGNDLIEFFDSYGNPNIKLKNVVKDGQPNYNSVDGIYFDGINTYIKSGNTIKTISLGLGGNASLPEGTILLYKGVTNPTGWYFYPESTGIDGLIYISNKQYTGRASIELYERGSITKSATVGDTYNLPFSEIAARYATTLADYSDISGELYFEVTGTNGYTNCATLSDDDTYLTFDRFGECKVTARVDGTSSHTAASYEYILKVNKKTYNLLFLDPPQISTSVNTWIHLLDYIDKPTFGDNNLLNEVKFYLNGLLVTEYMQLTSVGYNSVLAILPSTNLYEEAKSGYLTFMVSNSGTTDYNGSVQSFDIFGNSSSPATIKYMKTLTNTKPLNKSEFTTSVPSALDAGTYYIWYTINNGDIDGPVVRTISPKVVSDPTIILSWSNYTYDGNAKTPTVVVKDGNHVILASEYTVSYSNNTDIGTATVTVTNVTGGNYVVNGSTTFTISSTPKASITAAPTAKTLTYSGNAQDLVNAGTASNGTVYYKVTTSDTKPSDTTGFSSSIPTGTNAGTYYVWYYAKGDTGYDDGDISSSAITVTIAQEEETIETSASITDDYITEYTPGGNSIDNDHVKFVFVNNTGSTIIKYSILVDNGNGYESIELTVSWNNNTTNEITRTTNLTPYDSVNNWGPNYANVSVVIDDDTEFGTTYGLYYYIDEQTLYKKGKCYTFTFSSDPSNNTAVESDNTQSGSYVTSDSEIKVKIKNNTESNLTLTGAIKFKNNNTDIVSTTFNNSSVTINSGSSSTEYLIDFGNNAVTNTPSLTSIELTTSSNETISVALTNATFNMGALYTINYGLKVNSEEIVDNEDDVSNYYWAANNYIMDIAIDSYLTHNWNMGQLTMKKNAKRPCIGWEDYDKDKRERLVRAAVVPEFNDRFIYGGPYYVLNNIINGLAETELFTGEKGTLTYDRYKFTEILENQYSANDEETYIIKGPFTDLGLNLNSDAVAYFDSIRNIADTAGRDPAFGLNYGRVRPLGGLLNHSERRPKEVGNIWNSISSTKLIDIASLSGADNGNTSDINSDGPTSYPSGHSAQAWIIALGIALIYGSNSPNVVKYAAEAYKLGVDRTIGRFHWNSDTMYGRLWSTMIFPIVNAIKELNGDSNNLYEASCTQLNNEGHSNALPTDNNYTDSYFTTLVNEFNSITGVSISASIEKYLWSMYLAAETVRTSNHDFLKATTYPEVFPEEGYDVNIDGNTSTMKYRGDNIKYYCGDTELNSISQKSIMLSWLMAMCLAEIFYSNDTNEDAPNLDISIAKASLYNDYLNIQTLIFAKAYELGGGRKLDLYHEYQIDYDPTILRLAASLVYATERGKYSFSTIRGLNNTLGISIGNLDLTDRSVAEQSLGCIADRSSKKYSVGYGINTYYIFNDGAGPHSTSSGIYSSYIKNPFETKSVGTNVLNTQCQDLSLFIIKENDQVRINLIVENNSDTDIEATGEAVLYVADARYGHIGIKIVLDDSLTDGTNGPGNVHNSLFDVKSGDSRPFNNVLCYDGGPEAIGDEFESSNSEMALFYRYNDSQDYYPGSHIGVIGRPFSGTFLNGETYTITIDNYV